MEDWKEDILHSTKGMARAQPPKDAFERIQNKIKNQNNLGESFRGWLAIAATISLIILFNAYFIITYSSTAAPTLQNSNESYGSLVTNYNLYENDK